MLIYTRHLFLSVSVSLLTAYFAHLLDTLLPASNPPSPLLPQFIAHLINGLCLPTSTVALALVLATRMKTVLAARLTRSRGTIRGVEDDMGFRCALACLSLADKVGEESGTQGGLRYWVRFGVLLTLAFASIAAG